MSNAWRNPTHQQQTAAVRTAIESLSKNTQSQFDAVTTPEDWNAPTLAASWVNYGSGFAEAGYYKDGSGIVRLRGSIKDGTATANTTIFTLPVGYRPSAELVFPVLQAGTVLAQLNVLSTGEVQLGADLASSTFLSFDGIAFRAA